MLRKLVIAASLSTLITASFATSAMAASRQVERTHHAGDDASDATATKRSDADAQDHPTTPVVRIRLPQRAPAWTRLRLERPAPTPFIVPAADPKMPGTIARFGDIRIRLGGDARDAAVVGFHFGF